ncbi:serine protease, partial [Halobacteriales archaeon QS_8_69_26]
MSDGDIPRRSVLKGVGAGVGTAAAAGVVSGKNKKRVNVGFANPAGEKAARRAAANVKRRFKFDAMTIDVPVNAIQGLEKNPNIRYVEENGQMHAMAQTLPWGIDRVDADILHDEGETGSGADIAILDTGIDADHPDLQNNLGAGKAWVACDGSNGATCNYDWDDDNDHGTHCAGIADAVDNTEGVVGVATEATLHALKVLDSSGSGSFSDIAAAIEYTADQGWDVASMSLGASSGSSTVKDACTYAYENGVLLVGSAGNSGPCSDCVGYPAAYSEVIAVSSTDEDDSLSSFSSTGPEVELAAPGGSIESTVINGYDTFSGTSMSCPHVSGAGGHLMAKGYTNKEARQRLKDTAEDIGLGSNEQGAGLLDAENAVKDGSTGSLSVATDSATNVGDTSATLNGTLSDLGGASSADVYFEYGPSGGSLSNTTSAQTLSSTGSFSADVSGLNSGTEYEYRAVADASDGTSDTGSLVTFTTGSSSSCADASQWPDGSGVSGYEHITNVDMDGQVVESSSDNAYYDFTCPDVVTVKQGDSFQVALDYEDDGYDSHYANVYVDWDGDGSWSSSDETVIMENV